MGADPNSHSGDNWPNEDAMFRSFLSRLSELRANDVLSSFADKLVAQFAHGLSVRHPKQGTWFATLDAVLPDDNQVTARIRLCIHKPSEPKMPEFKNPLSDNRSRKPFQDEAFTAPTKTTDLVMVYCFLLVLSVDDNVRAFQEFASNELGRLRGNAIPPGKKHRRSR
jgi:hypothetical protein